MPIPALVEPSWKFIWNQIAYLHFQWKIHEQLCGKGQKRMDLLAGDAHNFFGIIQQALLTEVQLTLSKLGDSARSHRFENMTLAKLVEEIQLIDPNPNAEGAEFYERLAVCQADFADKSRKVRERRNKYLAHSDYDVALDLRLVPLETPTRAEIEEALKSLTAFMWVIEAHFGEGITVYSQVVTDYDADDLVNLLKQAERYKELIIAGKLPWTDLRESAWSDA
jgi:hypothetical protein